MEKIFWLVSVYSPKESREQNLARRIASSLNETDSEKCSPEAKKIIIRDEHDIGNDFGQNVRDTFPLGDVFINADDQPNIDKSINRFIELVFGNTFHTPTNEEFGMFHAFASALRSSSLSRQVGAAVTTQEGDIISTGTNEVPKAGGGLYGPDSDQDFREWKIGFDSNDDKKKHMLKDVLQHLLEAKWLTAEKSSKDMDELTEEASKSILKDIQLMNLTEFGREVHAEMAALMDAARRTIYVKNCILYCTTFPCHVCAKHIIASGLSGVVYIEPYPKSLAKELFVDSIALDETQKDGKVNFRPFVGVHPRRYIDLFSMTERKQNGKKLEWINIEADPRYSEPIIYLAKEEDELKQLNEQMQKTGLKEKN